MIENLEKIKIFFETAQASQWFYKLVQKTPFIRKRKILNPDIEICECESEYRQVSSFEYENIYTLKIETKKAGLCNYIAQYSWDGSEKDYYVEAFEKINSEEREIGVTEKLPNITESGVRTFVIIFDSPAKKESKKLIIKFKKLRDKKNCAKAETFYRPSNNKCKRIIINVSLLENKMFYKKVVDTNSDSPVERLNDALSHECKKSCSWHVHDDKDIDTIKEKEKYIVFWK